MTAICRPKTRPKMANPDAGLSDHEKARLEFQRSRCSVKDSNRRRARNAAIRRSKPKRTGGRQTIEGRPHPDRDKAICEQLLDFLDVLESTDAGADTLGAALLSFADCWEGIDPCRRIWCSKCERTGVQETGRRFTCVAREVDRMFLRAATILLRPIPIDDSMDAASVADIVRSAVRSLSEAVLASGIRMGHLLLPHFRVVHRSEIDLDSHVQEFLTSHDPHWRRHDMWLLPHLHGLIFLWEWSRDEDAEKLLRDLFPGNRSVMLKSWYANQTDEEAARRWGRYCGKKDIRFGASYGQKKGRLKDLYPAWALRLVDEAHWLLRDEPALAHWADSDELGLMSEEPVHVEPHEVWNDIRSDEEVLYEEWSEGDVENDFEEMRPSDVDGDAIEVEWVTSRLGGGFQRGSFDVWDRVGVKSSHYRPTENGQRKPAGLRNRGPPVRGPPGGNGGLILSIRGSPSHRIRRRPPPRTRAVLRAGWIVPPKWGAHDVAPGPPNEGEKLERSEGHRESLEFVT